MECGPRHALHCPSEMIQNLLRSGTSMAMAKPTLSWQKPKAMCSELSSATDPASQQLTLDTLFAKAAHRTTIALALVVISATGLLAHPPWGIVVNSAGIVYFSDLET